MGTVNYAGIAAMIGALTAFMTVVGTFVMQLLAYRRQGQILAQGKEIHKLVNGVSHELSEAKEKVAFGEGEKAGAATEQARGSA